MPSIDFTDIGEPEEWTPAPSGDYTLQLIEGEDTTAKKSGNPMGALKFEIVDCEGELEKYNGRTIYYYATYDETGLPRLKKMLQAFNVEMEEGKPLDWEWDEMIGLKVRANLRSVPPRPNKESPGEFYGAKNEIKRFLVDNEG